MYNDTHYAEVWQRFARRARALGAAAIALDPPPFHCQWFGLTSATRAPPRKPCLSSFSVPGYTGKLPKPPKPATKPAPKPAPKTAPNKEWQHGGTGQLPKKAASGAGRPRRSPSRHEPSASAPKRVGQGVRQSVGQGVPPHALMAARRLSAAPAEGGHRRGPSPQEAERRHRARRSPPGRRGV